MTFTQALNKRDIIKDYFNEIIKDPKPELEFSNEYELLIAVILSAQTTDVAVNKVTKVIFSKYKNFDELSNASIDDIKNNIRNIGLSNNKARYLKNVSLELKGKEFPKTREELESLPGVGRKTANVVLSNLHIENAFAVDTHVSRVSKRLGIASAADNPKTIEDKIIEMFKNYDYYLLHHQFILFGRYYCKAKHPVCDKCKLIDICNYKNRNGEKV